MEIIQNTSEYKQWIEELKSEIQKSQIKAAISVNQTLLDFYNRSGKAITNLSDTLPSLQSELAIETLKDSYKFDFLTLCAKALEKDIEEQLVKHYIFFT